MKFKLEAYIQDEFKNIKAKEERLFNELKEAIAYVESKAISIYKVFDELGQLVHEGNTSKGSTYA